MAKRATTVTKARKAKRKPAALQLTFILQPDDGQFFAYCPELDIIAADRTKEKALDGLVDMMLGYAEIYRADWALYQHSPFASHRPFVDLIAKLGSAEKVKKHLRVVGEAS